MAIPFGKIALGRLNKTSGLNLRKLSNSQYIEAVFDCLFCCYRSQSTAMVIALSCAGAILKNQPVC